MNRIEKAWKDLDFDQVDFSSSEWSFGCGGAPLSENEWSISHYKQGVPEIRYKMPPCINKMLVRVHEWGDQDRRQRIISALGV